MKNVYCGLGAGVDAAAAGGGAGGKQYLLLSLDTGPHTRPGQHDPSAVVQSALARLHQLSPDE